MAKPNLTWAFNNSETDNAWSSAPNAGQSFVVIDTTLDKLLFLDRQQTDGDSRTGTKYPIIKPETGSSEGYAFVDDYSEAVFDEVKLAGTSAGGGGNNRYVFAIYFSGATSGAPQLTCYNTSAHLAWDDAFLGAGTAANSTILGVATTNAVPGSATWAGTPLAGTDSYVSLDTGALVGAKALYFNIKQLIPYTFTPQSDSNIVLTCRFLYS